MEFPWGLTEITEFAAIVEFGNGPLCIRRIEVHEISPI